MQEMLKGCSTFTRAEEFRNLLPFFAVARPTKVEKELSMTSAHGDPVSPQLMHEAAVDVWMFLLIWSLSNGSSEVARSKARKAHSRRFLKQHQRRSKQPSGS